MALKKKAGEGRFSPGSRTVFILLGIISSVLVLFAYWYRPGFLVTLDLKATDAMFSARGPSKTPESVVIVAVDEKSVNELGRWPWPRQTTAALVTSLKPARVAALDIVFSESENAEADRALGDAIKAAGNIVPGFFFRNDSTQMPDDLSLERINSSKISFIQYSGSDDAIPEDAFPGIEFSGVETNINSIGEGALGFGSFNTVPQQDGFYRKAYLAFKYDSRIFPSLALEAVRRYYGGEVIIAMAPYGIDALYIGDEPIPLDEQGGLSLNFYGPGGSFKTYSAVDVIKGRVNPSELEGKLVFVGVTEKAVYDVRPTPVDSLYPGVEIHATAAGNIIGKRFLIHDSRVAGFDILMIFLLPLLLCIIISGLRNTFSGLGFFVLFLIGLVAGDFYLFTMYSVKAGVIFPAIALMLSYVSGEAYRNIVVEKRSRYLRKAFSTYVSSQLVSEILKDPNRLKLGGEKRVVTVLFSDIRGFTGLSERLAPEDLVKLLNEYLNPMTSIVLNQEGMLDKYIGDAIMAIFNAPLEVSDHPRRACASAVKMMEKLGELNLKWKELDYPPLEIGIGINTGEAVVGNMGAELRFDYTAIGDTVNLASRLEGLNKLYGTEIIVSEFTYEAVKGEFIFREIDLVSVKGKANPVAIYELVGSRVDGDTIADEFSTGLKLFRAKSFTEALEIFKSLHERYNDSPSGLYIKRCEEYLYSPPPSDWDGVYVAKIK